MRVHDGRNVVFEDFPNVVYICVVVVVSNIDDILGQCISVLVYKVPVGLRVDANLSWFLFNVVRNDIDVCNNHCMVTDTRN